MIDKTLRTPSTTPITLKQHSSLLPPLKNKYNAVTFESASLRFKSVAQVQNKIKKQAAKINRNKKRKTKRKKQEEFKREKNRKTRKEGKNRGNVYQVGLIGR